MDTPLLTLEGKVDLPGISEPFKVSDRFVVDTSATARVNISGIGPNFQNDFGDMLVESCGASSLSFSTITQDACDTDIVAALGGKAVAVTSIGELWQLMDLQPKGESGSLLNDDKANKFYVPRRDGSLRTVLVCWVGFGWYVLALELGHSWNFIRRVFFRPPREA
jgi:hypothetical protein